MSLCNNEVPMIIAHRGVPESNLEHTRPSYRAGIEQGADFLEPDVVATADGHLIIRHESEISHTTDVAERPEFASRKDTREIDGKSVTGWFSEDFTLEEIRSLRTKERIPLLRPQNKKLDGTQRVLAFEELLEIQAEENDRRGPHTKPIGVYVETKNPSYHLSRGIDINAMLLASLRKFDLDRAAAPVVIQSMEIGNLQRLAAESEVRRTQLIEFKGTPADQREVADGWNCKALVKPEGLDFIATYAHGIGPQKNHIIPRTARGRAGKPTNVVELAHERGLFVHAWTIRRENYFLAKNLRLGFSPRRHGRSVAEHLMLFDAGVDGLFSDATATSVAARAKWLKRR